MHWRIFLTDWSEHCLLCLIFNLSSSSVLTWKCLHYMHQQNLVWKLGKLLNLQPDIFIHQKSTFQIKRRRTKVFFLLSKSFHSLMSCKRLRFLWIDDMERMMSEISLTSSNIYRWYTYIYNGGNNDCCLAYIGNTLTLAT